MAIQYFCGRPGSGKSYGVIENVLLPALKINRPIYTNIPLNLAAIAEDYPDAYTNITVFDNEYISSFSCPGEYLMLIPGAALIIIDECWRWWASGVKVTDIPPLDKEFFAEHRHKVGESGLTQEIVLVSQSPGQIAKYLRDLIDQTVLTIKNTAAGSEKTFTVQIYSACIPSIDRPGEPQQTGLGRYKYEIFKYYKSHTKTETGLPGVEIRADKRLNVWNHWYINI
jgi:zona occludens toxin